MFCETVARAFYKFYKSYYSDPSSHDVFLNGDGGDLNALLTSDCPIISSDNPTSSVSTVGHAHDRFVRVYRDGLKSGP